MPPALFDRLIELADCETGTDTDTIGFRSSFNGWHLGFYGELSDGYKVVVDEFGHYAKKNFTQCEPTDEQLRKMAEKLQERADEIYRLKIEEEDERARWRQEEEDEARYGRPGAIYNKYY